MSDEQRRWFGTGLKGLCALILIFGLPTGYFASYADNIVDFLASLTGKVPDGFAKFVYVFMPFLIIEIACTGVMIFGARVIRRCYEFKAIRCFNGFYRWKSSRKEKGSNGGTHHLLYISNTWKGFILSLIGRWQPAIRYWRCAEGQVKTGNEIEFHYGMMFQHRRGKRSKQTVPLKDTIVLIGNDEAENIVFKCSLVANNEKALRIVTYRERMSSHQSDPVENDNSVYKQLTGSPKYMHNQIICKMISSEETKSKEMG